MPYGFNQASQRAMECWGGPYDGECALVSLATAEVDQLLPPRFPHTGDTHRHRYHVHGEYLRYEGPE